MYRDLLKYLGSTYYYMTRGAETVSRRGIKGAQEWVGDLVDHREQICNPDKAEKTSMADELDLKQIEMIRQHIDEMTTLLLSLEIV